jgi:tetratricopeptide (TPR) repeat protein
LAGNFWMGMVLEHDGKPADAMAAFKLAFTQRPAYRTRNRTLRAELLRILAAAKTSADTSFLNILQWFARAHQAIEAGRPKDAETELRKVLAVDPDHPFDHEQMAEVCDALRRPEEAAAHRMKRREAYRLELREAPDNADLHFEFAEFIANNKLDLVEGLALARRSVELEPLEPKYRAQLAELLARAKRWNEAIDEIKKAIEQNPEQDAYREALRAYQASQAGSEQKN